MKKQMIYLTKISALRSLFCMFLASVLFVSSAQAQQRSEESKPAITYLGKVNNQPLLQVEFENKEEKPYFITIHDSQGVQLYANEFTERKFSKKFRIALDEPSDLKLKITLSSGKQRETQIVELNTTSYVKEELLVSKL